MQYAGRVRLGEPVGNPGEQLDRAAPVAALVASHPVLERAVLDDLGHEVVAAVVLADVVNGQDVRMIERRRELRLAFEASARVGVELRRNELDCDRTLQPRVGCPIDDAHAAGAEPAVDAVRSEQGPGLEARILGSTWSMDVGRVVTAGH
jgi:hypothetical protein